MSVDHRHRKNYHRHCLCCGYLINVERPSHVHRYSHRRFHWYFEEAYHSWELMPATAAVAAVEAAAVLIAILVAADAGCSSAGDFGSRNQNWI